MLGLWKRVLQRIEDRVANQVADSLADKMAEQLADELWSGISISTDGYFRTGAGARAINEAVSRRLGDVGAAVEAAIAGVKIGRIAPDVINDAVQMGVRQALLRIASEESHRQYMETRPKR